MENPADTNVFISLKSLKNSRLGFGPTNEQRSKNAQWIDAAHERDQRRQDRWIYTTSLGLGPKGTPATSDPSDPRRHHRGTLLATPPTNNEPPPVPHVPLEQLGD